jgi:hypothetical protein
MSMRKPLKLKRELDMLEIDVQLWGLKLHSLLVSKKREVGQPVATNDVGENHEGNEVKFDPPPTFEEHEDQQDDDDKGACEAIIILGSPQKLEVKRAQITQGFEQHLIREECPYHQSTRIEDNSFPTRGV